MSAIALTYLMAGASPGDVIYAGKQQSTGLLSASNKTKLVNAVKDLWPAIVTAKIDSFECVGIGPERKCRAIEEYTPSDEEYIQGVIDGKITQTAQGDLSRVLAESGVPTTNTTLETFSQGVWSRPVDTVFAFKCWRSNKTDKTKVDCAYVPVSTVSPSVFRAAHVLCANSSSDACAVTSVLGRVK